MKTLVLMTARADADAGSLPELLAQRPWAAQTSRIVVQVAERGGAEGAPAYDAVVEIWSDASIAQAIGSDAALLAAWSMDIRTSQEVVGKPGGGAAPMGVTPGLSQLSFIRAIDGMAGTEAARHWDEHIPIACAIHVGMTRYVQDRLSVADTGGARWFGMAHLHFPDAAALRDGLFRGPEDIRIITQDVAEFVADHATMLATEHVVKA